jgi:hypothetical protein
MSDRLLFEQSKPSSSELVEEIPERSKRRWLLAALWIFSSVIGTTVWWVGLGWLAIWLFQFAVA